MIKMKQRFNVTSKSISIENNKCFSSLHLKWYYSVLYIYEKTCCLTLLTQICEDVCDSVEYKSCKLFVSCLK